MENSNIKIDEKQNWAEHGLESHVAKEVRSMKWHSTNYLTDFDAPLENAPAHKATTLNIPRCPARSHLCRRSAQSQNYFWNVKRSAAMDIPISIPKSPISTYMFQLAWNALWFNVLGFIGNIIYSFDVRCHDVNRFSDIKKKRSRFLVSSKDSEKKKWRSAIIDQANQSANSSKFTVFPSSRTARYMPSGPKSTANTWSAGAKATRASFSWYKFTPRGLRTTRRMQFSSHYAYFHQSDW